MSPTPKTRKTPNANPARKKAPTPNPAERTQTDEHEGATDEVVTAELQREHVDVELDETT